VYTFINSVGGAGWDFNAWDFDITPDNQVLIFTGTKCLVFDAATTTAVDSFEDFFIHFSSNLLLTFLCRLVNR
jgi:hypothetical protein